MVGKPVWKMIRGTACFGDVLGIIHWITNLVPALTMSVLQPAMTTLRIEDCGILASAVLNLTILSQVLTGQDRYVRDSPSMIWKAMQAEVIYTTYASWLSVPIFISPGGNDDQGWPT
jgi:hypothetical protein